MSQAYFVSTTCMKEDGSLDLDAQRRLWEHVVSAGVGLYVGSASPGEGYALERDEVGALLRLAAEVGVGRVPVRAMGVEPRTGAEMRDLLTLAAESGAEASQIYSLDMGHGGRPTDRELEHYLRSSIEAAPIPVVLSAHMSMGYLLPPVLVEQLAKDYDQLQGINVSSPDILYLCEIVDRVGGRLEICVGGPMHAMTALALGAQGFLCTEAAFVPELCQRVVQCWDAGEHPAAHAAYAEVMRWLRHTSVIEGMSVRRTKAMLFLQGLEAYGLRDPHAALRQEEIDTLRETLGRKALAVDHVYA